MAHDIFIAYSSHDKSVAEAVCAALESRHIRCWIAPRDVLPGTEWAEAIVDAIDGSRVLVLVLSASSNSSPQVIREVGRAASKGIPIVPLLIDDVSLSKAMEFFVSSHHWLDAQTPPLKKHLQRLVDTVQQLLTQEPEALKTAEIALEKEKSAISVERPTEAIKTITKPTWFWAGIVLSFVGLAWLAGFTVGFATTDTTGTPWYVLFIVTLVFALPFLIPGVFCLRRGMAQKFPIKPAEGIVPNWWWGLPVVLGFAGGIISWVKQKDVNWRKAMNMLTLGILATLIWTLPFLLFHTPLSPPPAPTPIPAPIVPGILVTLKYETFLPNDSSLVMADTWFFNKVAGLSDGRIEIEYHYEVPHSATLSPLLKAVGDGDIDCSLIPLGALPDLLPLSQGLTLNYLTYKSDALALAAKAVYNTFTPLREEWEVTNNVKVLYFLPLETSALCTVSPVSGVADLKGLYISSFVWTVDTLQRLGAEPVVVPSTDIYTALEREVIHGTFRSLEAISYYRLFELAEYLTEPWAGPLGMFATVINRDVWDSLPADIRSLMEELGDDTLEHYSGLMIETNRKAIKEMVTAGVNFYLWPESEREIAQNWVQPAQAQAWIEETGTSGQELITRLQEEVAVYEPHSTYKSGFEIWQEEYGVPSPGLLYEDDFSNPTSGWARQSEEEHELDYEDGEYHILVKKSGWSAWAYGKRAAGYFTDFTLEIDTRLVSGPEGAFYGVVFRFRDDDNFYRFLVSGDGYYLVETRLDGKWTILQRKTKSAFIKEGNITNHLKVVCKGSEMEVYANGHYLTTITDNTFTEGYVGMIVDTPEPDTRVAFDNIRVYSQEEYAVPSPGLLFEDDFSDLNSGWERKSSEICDTDYKDDEYHIRLMYPNWSIFRWNLRSGQLTDFALEIDARLVSGSNQSAYGVMFRAEDYGNFYCFDVTADGDYLLGGRLDGKWFELQRRTKSAFIKEGNSINHLKVVCQGSQIEVYVNGHYLTSVTDNSFTEGYIGVVATSVEPDIEVAFDNIRVYSLD